VSIAWVIALAAAASPEEIEAERAEVAERLEAERKAFDVLRDEKQELLTVLDTLQRLFRESTRRAVILERQRTQLEKRRQSLNAAMASGAQALAEQERLLAPRVFALYRLKKRDALATLLASNDFAASVRRERGISTLVAADVRAFHDLTEVAQYRALMAQRLAKVEAMQVRLGRALRSEQAVGQARLARFRDVVASIGAEQNRVSRIIAELEASERELSSMVGDLTPSSATSELEARKGHLPFPTQGMVEVGFGRVVNPRFNTVTVQKGIDLRANAGTPVVSVARGTVVWVGWLKGYGSMVIVDHGEGYHSLYAHLGNTLVETGNEVEEGEEIGEVGDTGSLKGPFLYFEIRKKGLAIDPLPWLEEPSAERGFRRPPSRTGNPNK
jgi:septal ring factor EnvC (AmiA/AmiB activator)